MFIYETTSGLYANIVPGGSPSDIPGELTSLKVTFYSSTRKKLQNISLDMVSMVGPPAHS